MKRRVLAGAALAIAATGLLVFGGAGAVRVWQLKQEVEALEREIKALRAEADQLNRTVDRLREDPALIEQIAREELGMVKGGEKVLKFPQEKR
ncbi:MAG: septum formation initiator family protein [Candidatus Rokubacteria bacterium]|nr:septum formation initiator family protein [Candidatus Rokubacteria bacterium]MBI2553342.1 septum formation initiator family protein [Candidatus Rokubacteria bacterium]